MHVYAWGARLREAAQYPRNWSLMLALGVSVVVGCLLGHSSLATAQSSSQTLDSSFFAETGYGIAPAMLDYFQHHGGVRTLPNL